jgi:hypothetical protein
MDSELIAEHVAEEESHKTKSVLQGKLSNLAIQIGYLISLHSLNHEYQYEFWIAYPIINQTIYSTLTNNNRRRINDASS